jgi:hypothetical protein
VALIATTACTSLRVSTPTRRAVGVVLVTVNIPRPLQRPDDQRADRTVTGWCPQPPRKPRSVDRQVLPGSRQFNAMTQGQSSDGLRPLPRRKPIVRMTHRVVERFEHDLWHCFASLLRRGEARFLRLQDGSRQRRLPSGQLNCGCGAGRACLQRPSPSPCEGGRH